MNDAQEFLELLRNAVRYAERELDGAVHGRTVLYTADTDPHVTGIELAKMIVQSVNRISPR